MQQRQLKWIGRQAKTNEGPLSDVVGLLPTFEKVPFEYGGQVSDNLEAVVRVPTDERPTYPITTVSKGYKLVQHHEVVETIKKASDVAGFSDEDSKCYLNVTQNGERMWFTMDFPERFNFDPGDGEPLTLQFHILNSVDRSIPLCFDLGWFRWVCKNGMFSLSRELASKRTRHTASLEISQYVDILQTAVGSVEDEMEFYKLAHQKTVQVGQGFLENWVDQTLSPRWGLRLAARSYHIIEKATDGKAKLAETPEEDRKKAHKIHVTDEVSVPGQQPAENLYDVIGALSWVASHQTTLQTRRWMMRDVSRFSNDLMQKLG